MVTRPRTSSLDFARAARVLADEARGAGLAVPGFRSPPRRADLDRALRRRSGLPPAVVVRLAGRPFEQVVSDMVDGVVAANGLTGASAEAARARLRAAVRQAEPVRRVA